MTLAKIATRDRKSRSVMQNLYTNKTLNVCSKKLQKDFVFVSFCVVLVKGRLVVRGLVFDRVVLISGEGSFFRDHIFGLHCFFFVLFHLRLL